MIDQEVKALFAALDAEPPPQFIATLRARLESEWPGTNAARRSTGERHVPATDIDVGDMIERRDAVAKNGSGHESAHGWTYAVGIAAAVSLVVMLMMVVRSRDVEAPAELPVTVERPPTTLPVVVGVGDRVRARIPVENTADSIAIDDHAVWVSGWDGQLVSRIDVDTNQVVTVDVGSTGTRVSSGDAGVWVGVDGGKVLRLDPLTAQVLATVDIGGAFATPLSGHGAVWVVTPEESPTLTRVDPVTNEVTARIDVAGSGTGTVQDAMIADGKVWVSSCEGGVVSIDEQTLAVSEPIPLDGCAGTLGFTDESLWVALDDQRTVRVDPVSGAVTAVVEIGPTDGAPFMATGDGAVWVPVTTGTVARIDTATNTVTDILDLGRTGQAAGLSVGHGSLWAGDYNQTTVLRIDP